VILPLLIPAVLLALLQHLPRWRYRAHGPITP
jgi:hypothetical protein